jgi:hypothetical protein
MRSDCDGGAYQKIYTYNGLADSWVEFDPEANNQPILLGDMTAAMSRWQGGYDPDYIYAFDPQREITDNDNRDVVVDYGLPERYELGHNYPNPFNPATFIEYNLPVRSEVKLYVYNLLGQKVATLVDRSQPAGKYRISWDGTDEGGRSVASGFYFYRIDADNYCEARKMLLLK